MKAEARCDGRHAFDSFDPQKVATKKQKRIKQQHAPAAATAALQPVAAAAMQANAAVPRAAAAILHTISVAPEPPGAESLRDWALLRAWKELAGHEEVLEALRTQ